MVSIWFSRVKNKYWLFIVIIIIIESEISIALFIAHLSCSCRSGSASIFSWPRAYWGILRLLSRAALIYLKSENEKKNRKKNAEILLPLRLLNFVYLIGNILISFLDSLVVYFDGEFFFFFTSIALLHIFSVCARVTIVGMMPKQVGAREYIFSFFFFWVAFVSQFDSVKTYTKLHKFEIHANDTIARESAVGDVERETSLFI